MEFCHRGSSHTTRNSRTRRGWAQRPPASPGRGTVTTVRLLVGNTSDVVLNADRICDGDTLCAQSRRDARGHGLRAMSGCDSAEGRNDEMPWQSVRPWHRRSEVGVAHSGVDGRTGGRGTSESLVSSPAFASVSPEALTLGSGCAGRRACACVARYAHGPWAGSGFLRVALGCVALVELLRWGHATA